jgi:hypothetical protein
MPKGKRTLADRVPPGVKADLLAELGPLLMPYFHHQGWPSLEAADTATEVLVEIFREMGVMPLCQAT